MRPSSSALRHALATVLVLVVAAAGCGEGGDPPEGRSGAQEVTSACDVTVDGLMARATDCGFPDQSGARDSLCAVIEENSVTLEQARACAGALETLSCEELGHGDYPRSCDGILYQAQGS